MSTISFSQKGDFKNTERFLKRAKEFNITALLDKCGRQGVAALASATPVESGLTASSWGYEITNSGGVIGIMWTNSHVIDGVNIAIILQYGHGTRNGGFVQGLDYINPAIRPIFDKIAEDVWKGVTKL